MSEVIAVSKKDFRNVPFSRHKLKSGTSRGLPVYRVLWSQTPSILMTRVDPNLRIDIIGAFWYRNRIIRGIKLEHTAGTLSAEHFLPCGFPISVKELRDLYLHIRNRHK